MKFMFLALKDAVKANFVSSSHGHAIVSSSYIRKNKSLQILCLKHSEAWWWVQIIVCHVLLHFPSAPDTTKLIK